MPQVITHGGDVYTFSEGDLSEVNETMLSILEVSPGGAVDHR